MDPSRGGVAEVEAAAADELVLLLLLGAADAVEAVRITWPDGTVETFPGGPADRHVTLSRGGGTVVP